MFLPISSTKLESISTTMPNDKAIIQHVIYAEGKTPTSWIGSIINVVPYVPYSLKVEVLRNDLAGTEEKVSNIKLDGVTIGDCNPDGGDYDCTFFDCGQSLTKTTITSSNGSIIAALTYSDRGHTWDCDCDKNTWDCRKQNTMIGFTPMTAVARFTLTPIPGNVFNPKQLFSIVSKYPQ